MRTTIALLLVLLSSASGFCGKTAEDLEKASAALVERKEPAALTVGEWKTRDQYGKIYAITGLMAGQATAECLIMSSESGNYRDRLYLLNGWRMPSPAYVSEVSATLNDKATNDGWLCAAFVRAEAAFARAADQEARAKALIRCVSDVVIRSIMGSEGDVMNNTPKDWKDARSWGYDVTYTAGFLEGVRVERAAAQVGVPVVRIPFRVGQISEEMERLSGSTLESVSVADLFLTATLSLVKQASGK